MMIDTLWALLRGRWIKTILPTIFVQIFWNVLIPLCCPSDLIPFSIQIPQFGRCVISNQLAGWLTGQIRSWCNNNGAVEGQENGNSSRDLTIFNNFFPFSASFIARFLVGRFLWLQLNCVPSRFRRFSNRMQSVTLGIKDDAASMKMPLQIIFLPLLAREEINSLLFHPPAPHLLNLSIEGTISPHPSFSPLIWLILHAFTYVFRVAYPSLLCRRCLHFWLTCVALAKEREICNSFVSVQQKKIINATIV